MFFENRLSMKWIPGNAGQIWKKNLHCQGSHCPASPGTGPFCQSDGCTAVPSATPALNANRPHQPPASSGARPFQQPVGSAAPRRPWCRMHGHPAPAPAPISTRTAIVLLSSSRSLLCRRLAEVQRGKWRAWGVVLHDPYPLEFGLRPNDFFKSYSSTMKFQSRSLVKTSSVNMSVFCCIPRSCFMLVRSLSNFVQRLNEISVSLYQRPTAYFFCNSVYPWYIFWISIKNVLRNKKSIVILWS